MNFPAIIVVQDILGFFGLQSCGDVMYELRAKDNELLPDTTTVFI